MRITLDVFSGPANPVIKLNGAKADHFLNQLKPMRYLADDEREVHETPWLGYRGLLVEATQDEASTHTLPRRFRLFGGYLLGQGAGYKVPELVEREMCDANGPFSALGLPKGLFERLDRHLDRAPELLRSDEARRPWLYWDGVASGCQDAPPYQPSWWNRRGVVELNNCYSYATNYRSDSRAEPGRAGSSPHRSLLPPYACGTLKSAAGADGLVDAPDADNRCPAEGHLVALMMDAPYDWHWLRKDRNGLWSHKPGTSRVTNQDANGRRIVDPRSAAFLSYFFDGDANFPPYEFCGFMVVPPVTRVA